MRLNIFNVLDSIYKDKDIESDVDIQCKSHQKGSLKEQYDDLVIEGDKDFILPDFSEFKDHYIKLLRTKNLELVKKIKEEKISFIVGVEDRIKNIKRTINDICIKNKQTLFEIEKLSTKDNEINKELEKFESTLKLLVTREPTLYFEKIIRFYKQTTGKKAFLKKLFPTNIKKIFSYCGLPFLHVKLYIKINGEFEEVILDSKLSNQINIIEEDAVSGTYIFECIKGEENIEEAKISIFLAKKDIPKNSVKIEILTETINSKKLKQKSIRKDLEDLNKIYDCGLKESKELKDELKYKSSKINILEDYINSDSITIEKLEIIDEDYIMSKLTYL